MTARHNTPDTLHGCFEDASIRFWSDLISRIGPVRQQDELTMPIDFNFPSLTRIRGRNTAWPGGPKSVAPMARFGTLVRPVIKFFRPKFHSGVLYNVISLVPSAISGRCTSWSRSRCSSGPIKRGDEYSESARGPAIHFRVALRWAFQSRRRIRTTR